jgi:hypothetical protein
MSEWVEVKSEVWERLRAKPFEAGKRKLDCHSPSRGERYQVFEFQDTGKVYFIGPFTDGARALDQLPEDVVCE